MGRVATTEGHSPNGSSHCYGLLKRKLTLGLSSSNLSSGCQEPLKLLLSLTEILVIHMHLKNVFVALLLLTYYSFKDATAVTACMAN